MDRRFKRFRLKDQYENKLMVKIQLSKNKYIQGSVYDLTVSSLGVILDEATNDPIDLVDQSFHASLTIDGNEVDLNKVYILSSSKYKDKNNNETKQTKIVLKTLTQNIPIEKVMKYVNNQDGSSPFSFELNHGKFTIADFYRYNGSDDILEKTNLYSSMAESWKKKDVYQYERYRAPSMGKRVILDYKRENASNEFLVFSSNDYLGFASHPEVIEEVKLKLDLYGFGSTGSPITSGLTDEHLKLKKLLAKIFSKESALLFNSGYTANAGMLTALCRKNDIVIYDQLSHASIQDALISVAANGAKCLPFKHNNMDSLEKILQEHRSDAAGCLIVTEGIFSMDGDIADMKGIVALAKKYNARTYLDVAHDFGIIGETGLGAAEHHDVLDQVDIIMGTFSKISGAIGGFGVASKNTVEYLRTMARSYVFSVTLPPSNVAGITKSLELFDQDKSILNRLKENIKYFGIQLRKLNIDIPYNHESTIFPVIVGDETKLEEMSKVLFSNGIFVTPITFPAVSKSSCRFRFTVSAIHDRTDLDYAILVLKVALEKVGLIKQSEEETTEASGDKKLIYKKAA